MDKNVKLVVGVIVLILGVIVGYRFIVGSRDDTRIITVPESYGPVVAIARRPLSITIAFESGDILVVRIRPLYGDYAHFKVVWQ